MTMATLYLDSYLKNGLANNIGGKMTDKYERMHFETVLSAMNGMLSGIDVKDGGIDAEWVARKSVAIADAVMTIIERRSCLVDMMRMDEELGLYNE